MSKLTNNVVQFKFRTLYILVLLVVLQNAVSQTSPRLNGTSPTILENSTQTTTTPTTANPLLQPRNPGDKPNSTGILCESDNDEIGQKLGCSCDTLTGGIKSANCSEQWIGYNISLNLPQRLNISKQVRILDLSKNHLQILDENTFGDCDSLIELNLYKNHIASIKSLSCSRIKKLDLSWNRLHNLTNESFMNLSQLMVNYSVHY